MTPAFPPIEDSESPRKHKSSISKPSLIAVETIDMTGSKSSLTSGSL